MEGAYCRRIFFDFNSTIHESARDTMRTFDPARERETGDGSDDGAFESAIMREAMRRLLARSAALFGTALPHDFEARLAEQAPCAVPASGGNIVYIAIDGVPPRAKMQQQRYRRFAAAWHREMASATAGEQGSCKYDWDTNAITPGTRFMIALESFLHAHVPQMEALLGARVLVSGSSEPGEGEQKIFNFLRADACAESTVDVVYGLDADLILQAMMLQHVPEYAAPVPPTPVGQLQSSSVQELCRRLWIYREARDDDGKEAREVLIDVAQLLVLMRRRHECDAPDFALLCVLLGNDFLPKLPCTSIGDGGIDLLLQLRKQVLSESSASAPARLVSPQGVVLLPPLLRILELLAQREDELMVKSEEKHATACERERMARKRPGQASGTGDNENLPLISPFPNVVKCHLPGWRPRYHHHVLSIEPSVLSSSSEPGAQSDAFGSSNQLNDMCACYLKGWIWSFRYTHQVCLSKHWCYPHAAAPTAMDLFNYVVFHHSSRASSREVEAELRDDEARESVIQASAQASAQAIRPNTHHCVGDAPPHDQRLQLLMVLPPQSAHLLDINARRLMHELKFQTCHMYPTGFVLGKYLKYRTWECHPSLPTVDVVALIRALRCADHDIAP